MGGSSGILTANSKSELEEIAIKWYNNLLREYPLYPRISGTLDINQLKKEGKLKGDCRKINLIEGFTTIICIRPLKELKDSWYYSHLRDSDKKFKYGCIVTAHT